MLLYCYNDTIPAMSVNLLKFLNVVINVMVDISTGINVSFKKFNRYVTIYSEKSIILLK